MIPARVGRLASISLGAACFAAQAFAGPPAVGTAFQSVRISGQKLGSAYTSSGASLEYTVVFDPVSGVYHLWCFTGATADKLGAILHATSPDGIDFSPTGNLSYAAPPNFASYGAIGEPTTSSLVP